jgi:nucleoside-diphosphate-sugar epimerase
MRTLVTGASGFIGSHVATHLAAAGHEVVASGRDARRLEAVPNAHRQACDLVDGDLAAMLRSCEVVVHCAARAAPWGERSLFWRDNVLATQRLLEAARAAGTVRRFVFVSTPSIYFRARDQLQITEAFTPPLRWETAYAETKWIAETHVLAARDLGPVVLRPRAVFGPRDAAIVPRLSAVARSGAFPLPGAGRAWTDVTCVENVVDAICAAIAGGPQIEGHAFNITNGEPLRVRDLLGKLFGALGLAPRYISVPRGLALALAGVSESYARLKRGRPEPRLTRYGVGLLGYSLTLSIAAARRELGYVPGISLDEGIARYARWYRS